MTSMADGGPIFKWPNERINSTFMLETWSHVKYFDIVKHIVL